MDSADVQITRDTEMHLYITFHQIEEKTVKTMLATGKA